MHDDIDINLAQLNFQSCERLNEDRAPEQALAALGAVGATFLSHDGETDYLLEQLSSINTFLQFAHSDLDEDSGATLDRRHGVRSSPLWRTASCTLDAAERGVLISQSASLDVQGAAGADRTFAGLLRVGERLFPHLLPTFGLLDDYGDPEVTSQAVQRLDLEGLGWANFFGPPLVARLGRAFLHDAPAWRVTDLPGGGVLVLAHESFVAWRYDPYFGERWPYSWDARLAHPLARHFQRYFPGLVIYRGKRDVD